MKQVRTIAFILAGLAVLIVFPLVFPNPAVTSVAIFTLLFAVAATAWNMFSGYTGYISLGHASYLGAAAYISALLTSIGISRGDTRPFSWFLWLV